ncbi:hypothetical protein [Mycobacterium sp.]|uniref:hypothetical protein n=1 Tax=Mycobacterium sp. TaxID=1785 RepID=UPI003F98AD37
MIGPDATAIALDGALATDDGALAVHDGTLGADFVTVTVEGELDVLAPQEATVSTTVHTAAPNWAIFRSTVAGHITAGFLVLP